MKILIINGPNLNLLGKREPDVYGRLSFEDYLSGFRKRYPRHTIDYFQSNHEGALIDRLQAADADAYDGIILNAAGYTHTSVALADAVAAISVPVIEVHISNIHAREGFRQHSYLGAVCAGHISGMGLSGYDAAMTGFILKQIPDSER